MIRKISRKFVDYVSENKYSCEEKEEMTYVLNTIIFEALKLIGTIVIFAILGYLVQCIIIIVIMITTKPYIGGYHEDSQIKCFLTTVILTGGIIFMSQQTTFSFYGNCAAILFCIFCMYNEVPVINDNMPLTRPYLIKKNRRHGLTNIVIISIISILIYRYSKYYCIITWSILAETILLFNKKIKE